MHLFKSKKKQARDNAVRTFQIISKNASFPYVEAYKTLRTNLSFVSVSNAYKKIIVTGAVPEEGKTNVAINLAISLSESGAKVLMVDCDLRKPMVQKYLRIAKKVSTGLTNVLSGAQAWPDTVVHFKDIGIDVLVAGAIPPNPAELLGSAKMGEVIEEMAAYYDYVIFDTPPVSVVTDAAVLSRYTDGVILVVRQDHAHIDQIQLAKKNLETVGANIIGAVLNDFDAKATVRESGYYYSYNYDYQNNG